MIGTADILALNVFIMFHPFSDLHYHIALLYMVIIAFSEGLFLEGLELEYDSYVYEQPKNQGSFQIVSVIVRKHEDYNSYNHFNGR